MTVPGGTHGVITRRITVIGRVQGVWFRGATAQRARSLGVSGHARNLDDGSVEVLAAGPAGAVAAPIEWLWQGPPAVSALLGVHMSAGALAFTLTFFLLKLAGPVYFSQVAYLVTLFGIGFGMLVFDERHPPGAWAALLLIFAGIALVNRRTG